MIITAAQHAAATLTGDQSPKGRGGYQTLFYTHDLLSQEDIRAIERRVQYNSDEGEKAKWQYYWLPDQRPVITRLIPIPEPDEFGRRGRFFAHSLIFNAADLRTLDDAPFDLLKPENFLASFEKVIDSEELQKGKIGTTSIKVVMEWDEEALGFLRDWPGEQLDRLITLLLNQQEMTTQGRYIALIGNDAKILETLRIAYLLLPSSIRKTGSFDTNATGCDWQRDAAFWIRGFGAETETNSRYLIDTAQRQVQSPASFASSPYSQWVGTVVKQGKHIVLNGNLERAQSLSALLEGHPTNWRILRDRDEELEITFAEANSKLIAERVTEFLPGQLSPTLSQAVITQISKTPKRMLRWLIEGNQYGISFRDPVYQSLLHTPELSLTATDLDILKPLSNGHQELGLILALKSSDEYNRLKILRDMTPNDYTKCVKEFQKHLDFKTWQFFSPQHLGGWFYLFQGAYRTEDLIKAISSVAEHGSKRDQQQIADIVFHLESDKQQELRNWINTEPYDLPKLKLALEGRFEPDSVFQRWKNILTRKGK